MKYLISGKEMKNWEKKAMEKYKVPSLLLMERAAQKVVDELLCGSYQLKNILIACGNVILFHKITGPSRRPVPTNGGK